MYMHKNSKRAILSLLVNFLGTVQLATNDRILFICSIYIAAHFFLHDFYMTLAFT